MSDPVDHPGQEDVSEAYRAADGHFEECHLFLIISEPDTATGATAWIVLADSEGRAKAAFIRHHNTARNLAAQNRIEHAPRIIDVVRYPHDAMPLGISPSAGWTDVVQNLRVNAELKDAEEAVLDAQGHVIGEAELEAPVEGG